MVRRRGDPATKAYAGLRARTDASAPPAASRRRSSCDGGTGAGVPRHRPSRAKGAEVVASGRPVRRRGGNVLRERPRLRVDADRGGGDRGARRRRDRDHLGGGSQERRHPRRQPERSRRTTASGVGEPSNASAAGSRSRAPTCSGSARAGVRSARSCTEAACAPTSSQGGTIRVGDPVVPIRGASSVISCELPYQPARSKRSAAQPSSSSAVDAAASRARRDGRSPGSPR